MKNLTKLEILNETIAFYNGDVNRRSKSEDNECAYNGKNGTHCAYGRCMLPEYKTKGELMDGNCGTIRSLASVFSTRPDELLEEKYRGNELDFWVHIQILHDRNEHWDKAGLSVEGEKYANEICKTYNLKPETNA